MVDVVLPVLDEADALPWVLSRLPAGFRAIVVDNGSVDGSADVARRHGATVVAEPQRGFGAACWAGLRAATAEVVAFCDADGSLDLRDLDCVVDPLCRGESDLAIAARAPTGHHAWPLHARVANRCIAWRVRRSTGVQLSDLGPMRAARREPLVALGIADRRSGWPLEMVLRAANAGWRITETTAPYYPRTGRSKVTGTVRGTLTASRDMARVLGELR